MDNQAHLIYYICFAHFHFFQFIYAIPIDCEKECVPDYTNPNFKPQECAEKCKGKTKMTCKVKL